ncbi:MAG: phosphopantothenate--cysteine ligase [Firmicutes bacterium]|nr:phosphopantothenate--cysteine ligase [Bacillota bacterium]
MKIVITAGGTSERIDDVRTITNSSTGSLGFAIGNAFIAEEKVEKIYYLHGKRAVWPEHEKIEPIEIGGVMDLKENITRVLTEDKIDAVIHAMAVSDYMVHQVTTLDKLMGTEDPAHAQDLTGNKISSDIDDLIIHMKRSPKVISCIKEVSPESILVGFKLLSGVPHEELIEVGYRLLQKNNCDFVMANDLREIGNGFHKGYLIHKDKTYDSMNTNEEIAAMIVRRVLEEKEGV